MTWEPLNAADLVVETSVMAAAVEVLSHLAMMLQGVRYICTWQPFYMYTWIALVPCTRYSVTKDQTSLFGKWNI